MSDRQAFYRESLLWKNQVHDHVLQFLGVAEDVFGGTVCMVIPWMENGSLRQFLERKLKQEVIQDGPLEVTIVNWVSSLKSYAFLM